jgi:hypothetical protein
MKQPRKDRKPRQLITLAMILTRKGGAHVNRAEKRTAQKDRKVEARSW